MCAHHNINSQMFSRSAILGWANDILGTSCLSFNEVAAKDVALLLYGMVCLPGGAPRQQVLSQWGGLSCDGSSRSSGATAASLCPLQQIQFCETTTAAMRVRNGEHVLGLIRRLSEAHAKACSGTEASLGSGSSGAAVMVVSPHLTAEDWLDGKAFVDELRIWRWMRTLAADLAVSPSEVKTTIRSFLSGGETVRSVSQPAVVGESMIVLSHAALDGDDVQQTSICGVGKRSRQEELEVAKTEAMESVSCLAAAESPSLVEETVKKMRLEANPAANSSNSNGAHAGPNSASARSSAAAAETAVTRTRDGLDVARECCAVLQERTQALAAVVGESIHQQPGIASLAKIPLPAQSKCSAAAQAMVCTKCPTIFAHALQCNLTRIQHLEETRAKAIAACMKKDAAALLTALAEFA